MLDITQDAKKIISYSKVIMFPTLILGIFLVYFFSINKYVDETYKLIHNLFLSISILTLIVSLYYKIIGSVVSIFAIYLCYIIINNTRYMFGEDYVFSSAYNVWIIIFLPTLILINYFAKFKSIKYYWSGFFVFLLMETFLIEKMLNQTINTDATYFYKHVGMMNYPSIYVSLICIFYLLAKYISKGKILIIKTLFSSISIMLALYFSNILPAFSLFFLSAIFIEFVVTVYYIFYIRYKNEELNIANLNMFYKESEKKYPPKYSITLLYIDDYERLLKRFGERKIVLLKKMFLKKISKTCPDVKIYNYHDDALILGFVNIKTNECFEKAEEIRRAIATSIFVFNENNHLQLTVSQCVSEKKRSDNNAEAVLQRAEISLKKACKFTRNITVKA